MTTDAKQLRKTTGVIKGCETEDTSEFINRFARESKAESGVERRELEVQALNSEHGMRAGEID
jgi:hypothetical protein